MKPQTSYAVGHRAYFTSTAALGFALLGFAILNGLILWKVREPIAQGYGDFAAFYTAGEILHQGHGERLYDPGLQWQIQQEFASQVAIRKSPLPYIRPAFEACLFLPFTYVSYAVAYLLWTVLKLAILLAIPFLLDSAGSTRTSGDRWRAIKILVCFAYFPVAFDLLQGQDSILLVMLFVLAFRCLERGKTLAAGAFLGLGVFKFHLTVPLLCIFLLRKKTKVVLGFLGTAVSLFLISAAVVGWSGMAAYPKYLLTLNQTPGLLGIKSRSMPNIRGLMAPLFGPGALPAAVNWALTIIAIIGIAISARFWRIECEDDRSLAAGFSFAIVMTIVTSYYVNSYDLTLLLLPMFVLGPRFLEGCEIRGWPRLGFLLSVGILLVSPVFWILALRLDQFYWIALVLLILALSIGGSLSLWQRSLRHPSGAVLEAQGGS
jgi:hypothetical protein